MVAVMCRVVGHDDLVSRQPTRLALVCRRCGRVSVGWSLDARPGSDDSCAAGPSRPARLPSAVAAGESPSSR